MSFFKLLNLFNRSLILVPNRELGEQVFKIAKHLSHFIKLKVFLIVLLIVVQVVIILIITIIIMIKVLIVSSSISFLK